jgi:hypothetical protein
MDFTSAIDYQFACLAAIVLVYLLVPKEGFIMATVADLAKHIENMKRATGIVNQAAADAPKHAAIMDSVESRMQLNNANMQQLAEYDKLMAAMETIGNGGPILDATFSSSTTVQPDLSSHSTIGVGKHGS